MKKMNSASSRTSMGFAGGLVLGVCVGLLVGSGGLVSAEGERHETKLEAKVLYSIATLAIDTEMNASRIIEAEERLTAIETQLEEMGKN